MTWNFDSVPLKFKILFCFFDRKYSRRMMNWCRIIIYVRFQPWWLVKRGKSRMGGMGFWKKVKNMYIINHWKRKLTKSKGWVLYEKSRSKIHSGTYGKKTEIQLWIYKDKRLISYSTVGRGILCVQRWQKESFSIKRFQNKRAESAPTAALFNKLLITECHTSL